MKKGKLTLEISISIVCIILISIMLAQFKTVEETDITGIKTAREEELKTMLTSWKSKHEETEEKFQETQSKIAEYKQKMESNEETEELLEEELQQTNMLAGKTDVVGEGIIVTLTDSEMSTIEVNDLITLINELRLAGAEAISINDQRIISSTEIVNAGNNILVNTRRIVSPYVVKAIGDQTYLSSALSLKNTGFIDNIKSEQKTITMTKEKNVKIIAYSGTIRQKYVKEVEE